MIMDAIFRRCSLSPLQPDAEDDSASLFDPTKPPIFNSEFEGVFDPSKPPVYDEEYDTIFGFPDEELRQRLGQIVVKGNAAIVVGKIWSGFVSFIDVFASGLSWYTLGHILDSLSDHEFLSNLDWEQKARCLMSICGKQVGIRPMEAKMSRVARFKRVIEKLLSVFVIKGHYKPRKKRYNDNDQSRVFDPGGCGLHVAPKSSMKQRIAF